MRTSLAIAALLGALLTACGATVGDPCTTSSECGGALCINRDYAPGGYCTTGCKSDDSQICPTGSVCVRDALANNAAACFRTCTKATECRGGYTCRSVNGSPNICVGAIGF
jgi:hypothetical protein